MNTYTYLCFLTTIAILISFITRKLNDNIQYTIAITATSMAGSLFLVLLGYFNWFNLDDIATRVIERIDFKDFLLNGILGFLLFAGALGIKLPVLNNQKWENYHFSPCSQHLPLLSLLVFYFMALPYFSDGILI